MGHLGQPTQPGAGVVRIKQIDGDMPDPAGDVDPAATGQPDHPPVRQGRQMLDQSRPDHTAGTDHQSHVLHTQQPC